MRPSRLLAGRMSALPAEAGRYAGWIESAARRTCCNFYQGGAPAFKRLAPQLSAIPMRLLHPSPCHDFSASCGFSPPDICQSRDLAHVDPLFQSPHSEVRDVHLRSKLFILNLLASPGDIRTVLALFGIGVAMR